jgi:hypothetical protein
VCKCVLPPGDNPITVNKHNKKFYLSEREVSYGLSGLVFDSQQQQTFLLLTKPSRPALLPNQIPVQWVRGFFPGKKRFLAI